MNYWALKDSTEKTHRAVHKRVKEYQVGIFVSFLFINNIDRFLVYKQHR